jgi:hypothetical protein
MPKSTLEEDDNHALLAVFRGDSGVGKSVAALSFPEPYLLDLDRKMPSIARKHFPEKDIKYDTFENVFELDEVVQRLKVDCPYKTIIVDSFTGLGKLCFNTMSTIKSEEGAKILKKFSTKAGEKVGIDYYFGENHYIGHFIDDMKTIHIRYKAHVIITAHNIQYEPINYSGKEPKEKVTGRPILAEGRKPAAILPTEVDNVLLFGWEPGQHIDDPVRRMCYTTPVADIIAKSSFRFPPRIDFTDCSFYDKLFSYEAMEAMAIANESGF